MIPSSRPLGVSRLVLSTSAIRRVFGTVGDLEFITTQDGRTLQDQNLRFIAVEQSDKITDALSSLGLDAITTQDGRFFALNQNPQTTTIQKTNKSQCHMRESKIRTLPKIRTPK